MSGNCPRVRSDRNIAITGVMPLPAVMNSSVGGGGLGSAKSPLGAARRMMVPGSTPLTKWADRKPSGVAFTVIEMLSFTALRNRGQRVRPPVPFAIDAQTDSRRTGPGCSRRRSPIPAG